MDMQTRMAQFNPGCNFFSAKKFHIKFLFHIELYVKQAAPSSDPVHYVTDWANLGEEGGEIISQPLQIYGQQSAL
jgi:hypothetical protein